MVQHPQAQVACIRLKTLGRPTWKRFWWKWTGQEIRRNIAEKSPGSDWLRCQDFFLRWYQKPYCYHHFTKSSDHKSHPIHPFLPHPAGHCTHKFAGAKDLRQPLPPRSQCQRRHCESNRKSSQWRQASARAGRRFWMLRLGWGKNWHWEHLWGQRHGFLWLVARDGLKGFCYFHPVILSIHLSNKQPCLNLPNNSSHRKRKMGTDGVFSIEDLWFWRGITVRCCVFSKFAKHQTQDTC